MVAIYATLGLAATLAGVVPHDVITAAFLLGMLLVGLTILTQGLQVRPGGMELAVALGVGTVYLLALSRLAFPERSHLIEYGVVASLVHEALLERAGQGRRVPAPGVLAVAVTSLLGLLDECLQLIIPSRVFDPEDIVFNVLAATMAVGAGSALRWARRRRRPP